ncbi:YfiM family protein [Fulvivirga ulvae]|uniref:DUF2279 domain-containing protein n=1 Tax=Fulvivirga ulvae TaxID=2904245 RepID=UPI001F2BA39B|nr:DUF2279 domain-containing protein [Fulvivirga ulvae]UII30220.1 YfiM family protein [Fulvivirga ulvae]
MKLNRFIALLSLQLILIISLQAQTDSTLQKKRLKPLVITSTIAYAGSLVALNQLWYADFERESFHFFDDSREWKQVDKAGHAYAAFHINSAGYEALRWAGLSENKSLTYGALSSIVVLSSIEVFDGFSSAYGASYTDLTANTFGTILFYGQKKLWKDIRIQPKFSFHRTDFPNHRPETLGKNLQEELLKDYNGQTYWLSLNLSKFNSFRNFPKWLNLAVGYGAHNMIYATDAGNVEFGLTPKRQYYLAIDFDFSEYKSESSLLNTVLYVLNMVHLPAPALEFSDSKFKFHYIY